MTERDTPYVLILAGGLTLMVLGLSLTVHAITIANQRRILQTVTKTCIFVMIVGLTNVVSSQLQALLGAAVGNNLGAVVGVALGSIIAAYSDDITDFVTSLSRLRLRILGTTFIALGTVISAFQLAANSLTALFHLGSALP